MKTPQLLLTYFVFVEIPDLIIRRIEKFFSKYANPKRKEKIGKKFKDLSELNQIP